MTGKIFEWLNENSYRAFPFEDDSSRLCSDGVVFPEWLVLDAKAVVFVPEENKSRGIPHVGVTKFSISRSATSYSLKLWLSVSGFDEIVVTVPEIDVGKRQIVRVNTPNNSTGHGSVSLTIGAPVDMLELENLVGTHLLNSPRRISRSRCIFSYDSFGADALYGNNWMVASGKVHLRDGYSTELRIINGLLSLKVSRNAGLGVQCPDTEQKCVAIHRINGQHADTNGNFSIVGGEGIKVSSGLYKGIPAVIVTSTVGD